VHRLSLVTWNHTSFLIARRRLCFNSKGGAAVEFRSHPQESRIFLAWRVVYLSFENKRLIPRWEAMGTFVLAHMVTMGFTNGSSFDKLLSNEMAVVLCGKPRRGLSNAVQQFTRGLMILQNRALV
jgi:hypothetical protein